MRTVVRELIETVILALVIFLVLQFSVQPYRVEGPSMEPNLTEGQYVLVNKLVYRTFPSEAVRDLVGDGSARGRYLFHPPRAGEIIVFRSPQNHERNFVKRVVGVPGDSVEIRRGVVLINGTAIDEPYIKFRDSRSMDALKVPPDSYFVLGDNRGSSDDSRNWKHLGYDGAVPVENIVGRAWVSYWPVGKWQMLSILPWR